MSNHSVLKPFILHISCKTTQFSTFENVMVDPGYAADPDKSVKEFENIVVIPDTSAMVTVANPEQSANARSLIVFTVLEIVTSDKFDAP